MSRSTLASAAIAIYQGYGAFMATAVGVMIVAVSCCMVAIPGGIVAGAVYGLRRRALHV